MGKKRLAALRDKVKTPQKSKPSRPEGVGHPVMLSCGHFDWEYDRDTDTCRLCEKGTFAYPWNKVKGVLIQLVHEMERLSNESSALLMEAHESDDPDIRGSAEVVRRRIYRLKDLANRGAALVSANETFRAHPGHVAIRDQMEWGQRGTVEAVAVEEQAAGEGPGDPAIGAGGAVRQAALDPGPK